MSADWRRSLWLLVALYAAIAIGRSAAFPFMPLFYLELGVRPQANAALWAGVTIGSSFLMAAIFSPIWGSVADRVGRKPMVMRASISLCIASILVTFVTEPWEVLTLRAFAGMFSGFSGAATALIATQVPEEHLGYALGWLATAQLSGSLIGPLLGGALADALHQNYRAVWFATAAIIIVPTIVFGLRFREAGGPRESEGPRERTSIVQQLREVFTHPQIAPMFSVVLLAQICAVAVAPVVPLFIASMVDPHWVATASGAAVAMTGIAGVIAAPLLGRRSDRIGYRRVLLISLAGAGCFTLPQALASSLWVFLALRFGVGLFLGGIMPTANAFIGRMVEASRRGRVYGTTSSASFLGLGVGPVIGAQIMAHFGFQAVFLTVGALMLLNTLWVAVGVRMPPVSGFSGRSASAISCAKRGR